MKLSSLLPIRGRQPKTQGSSPAHAAPTRAGVALTLEALEDRCLLSANVISGYVFNDVNNDGLYGTGETPIANNPIELINGAGVVVGQTTTNNGGFYQFASDASINVSPKTQSFSLSFPSNKTNQTQTGTLPKFDPSLGTLTSIDLIINGQITSDIKVENQDPSPTTINGVVSGSLNLAGPGFNTQVTTSSSTRTFNASAWDGVNDFAGTSGKDLGSATVPGSATVQVPVSALGAYSGTGSVTITETAQATSSANGGGNLLAQITSSGSANITVRYHYTPGNPLAPGNYTIVQMAVPSGYISGKFSRNGVVLPMTPDPHKIPVVLAGSDAPNNDFGERLPTADLSIVKTGQPNPVNVKAPLTYTLTVANAGPVTAVNVVVKDVLPPGVTFVSASGAGWTVTQSGGKVTATRSSMAVGASSVLTINVKAPATAGMITNTATVTSQTPDGNPSNNQSSAITQVIDQSVVISSTGFPPVPSSFPHGHDLNFLSKLDFLAVGGPSNLDPTVLALGTYVDGLYRTILNREADSASLVSYVRFLRTGGARDQVVDSLWRSDEHRAEQVASFYQAFLHRPVDPAGQASWVAAFHAGLDETGLAAALMESPEYLAAHPTDTAFINGVFQDVLGRVADAPSLAAWDQVLQSAGRDAVVRGILNSDEANLMHIQDDYVSILHRGADLAGQQSWLSQLRTGQTTVGGMTEAFLASNEFYGMAVAASLT
jgi:uncharacterized repeat protein (TIGR01451 family)